MYLKLFFKVLSVKKEKNEQTSLYEYSASGQCLEKRIKGYQENAKPQKRQGKNGED